MGIDSRDYVRPGSDGYKPSFGGDSIYASGPDAPACRWIMIATVIVYLLQIFSTRAMTPEEADAYRRNEGESFRQGQVEQEDVFPESADSDLATDQDFDGRAWYLRLPRICVVQKWLELDTSKVLSGQVWRLLTCAFCHDRDYVFHIVFNMLFLWWFGPTMESMFGSREFVWFYMTAAVAASLAYVGLDIVTGDPHPAVGASGAVMAVTSLYALYYPSHTIYVFFILPIEVRWLVIFYAIQSVHPVLLALSDDRIPVYDNVAHAAHLGGLVFGYLYGKQHWQLSQLPRYFGWGSGGGNPRSTIPMSRDVATSSRMDEILQKIHESGEESLTDEERRFLARESDRMKKRRD